MGVPIPVDEAGLFEFREMDMEQLDAMLFSLRISDGNILGDVKGIIGLWIVLCQRSQQPPTIRVR
jgi:hypothetical protein